MTFMALRPGNALVGRASLGKTRVPRLQKVLCLNFGLHRYYISPNIEEDFLAHNDPLVDLKSSRLNLPQHATFQA